MLKISEQEEEERVTVKKFEPRLILGGKEPPTDYGSDWLTPLEPGSVFFVQSKTDPMDFSLGLFRKLKQDDKVAVLESPQLPQEIYVNPNRFCNRYIKFQSCGIIEVKTKDNEDERNRFERDGTVQEGSMEGHVGEQESPPDVPPRK